MTGVRILIGFVRLCYYYVMKKFILAVVVVAVVAAAWLWYAGYVKVPFAGAPPQAPEAEVGFGGSIYNEVAASNPAADLPQTNPFKADVNPFTNAYKNPFGQ